MTLGEQLTIRLKRSGLNRGELAEKAGLSLPTIRKVLNDSDEVTLSVINKIATALNSKIKYTVE